MLNRINHTIARSSLLRLLPFILHPLHSSVSCACSLTLFLSLSRFFFKWMEINLMFRSVRYQNHNLLIIRAQMRTNGTHSKISKSGNWRIEKLVNREIGKWENRRIVNGRVGKSSLALRSLAFSFVSHAKHTSRQHLPQNENSFHREWTCWSGQLLKLSYWSNFHLNASNNSPKCSCRSWGSDQQSVYRENSLFWP